jgi:hypothetical protein
VDRTVRLTATPLSALPLTYVGHSPVREISVHKSHVYIDQRVCAHVGKDDASRPPTLVDHRSFARWLPSAAASAVSLEASAATRDTPRQPTHGRALALT